jgi:hypothetical protein
MGIRQGTVIRLDPTIYRMKDAYTLATKCDCMPDKVADNSDLAFSAIKSFIDYLSAGPIDMMTSIIPDDYLEAEPTDDRNLAVNLGSENARIRYSTVTVTTAKARVSDVGIAAAAHTGTPGRLDKASIPVFKQLPRRSQAGGLLGTIFSDNLSGAIVREQNATTGKAGAVCFVRIVVKVSKAHACIVLPKLIRWSK